MIPLYTPECRQCKSCLSGKTNLCTAIRATQGKGLMPDGTSRFSYKGQTIFHYMWRWRKTCELNDGIVGFAGKSHRAWRVGSEGAQQRPQFAHYNRMNSLLEGAATDRLTLQRACRQRAWHGAAEALNCRQKSAFAPERMEFLVTPTGIEPVFQP